MAYDEDIDYPDDFDSYPPEQNGESRFRDMQSDPSDETPRDAHFQHSSETRTIAAEAEVALHRDLAEDIGSIYETIPRTLTDTRDDCSSEEADYAEDFDHDDTAPRDSHQLENTDAHLADELSVEYGEDFDADNFSLKSAAELTESIQVTDGEAHILSECAVTEISTQPQYSADFEDDDLGTKSELEDTETVIYGSNLHTVDYSGIGNDDLIRKSTAELIERERESEFQSVLTLDTEYPEGFNKIDLQSAVKVEIADMRVIETSERLQIGKQSDTAVIPPENHINYTNFPQISRESDDLYDWKNYLGVASHDPVQMQSDEYYDLNEDDYGFETMSRTPSKLKSSGQYSLGIMPEDVAEMILSGNIMSENILVEKSLPKNNLSVDTVEEESVRVMTDRSCIDVTPDAITSSVRKDFNDCDPALVPREESIALLSAENNDKFGYDHIDGSVIIANPDHSSLSTEKTVGFNDLKTEFNDLKSEFEVLYSEYRPSFPDANINSLGIPSSKEDLNELPSNSASNVHANTIISGRKHSLADVLREKILHESQENIYSGILTQSLEVFKSIPVENTVIFDVENAQENLTSTLTPLERDISDITAGINPIPVTHVRVHPIKKVVLDDHLGVKSGPDSSPFSGPSSGPFMGLKKGPSVSVKPYPESLRDPRAPSEETHMEIKRIVKVSHSPVLQALFRMLEVLRSKADATKILVTQTDLYWCNLIDKEQQQLVMELRSLAPKATSPSSRSTPSSRAGSPSRAESPLNGPHSRPGSPIPNRTLRTRPSSRAGSPNSQLRSPPRTPIAHNNPYDETDRRILLLLGDRAGPPHPAIAQRASIENTDQALTALRTHLKLIFSEKISTIEALYIIAKDTVKHAVKMHIDTVPPPISTIPRAFHHIKEKPKKQMKKSPVDMGGKHSKANPIIDSRKAIALEDADTALRHSIIALADLCGEMPSTYCTVRALYVSATSTPATSNTSQAVHSNNASHSVSSFSPIDNTSKRNEMKKEKEVFRSLTALPEFKKTKKKRKKRTPRMTDSGRSEGDAAHYSGRETFKYSDRRERENYEREGDNLGAGGVGGEGANSEGSSEDEIQNMEQDVLSAFADISDEPSDPFGSLKNFDPFNSFLPNATQTTQTTQETGGDKKIHQKPGNVTSESYGNIEYTRRKSEDLISRGRRSSLKTISDDAKHGFQQKDFVMHRESSVSAYNRSTSAPIHTVVSTGSKDGRQIVSTGANDVRAHQSEAEVYKRDLPPYNETPCQFCFETYRGKGVAIPTVKQLDINDVCCPCPDLTGRTGITLPEGKHTQGVTALKVDKRNSSRGSSIQGGVDDRALVVSRTVGFGHAIGSAVGLGSCAGTGIGIGPGTGAWSGIGMGSGSGSTRRMSESNMRRASVHGQKSDAPVFNQLAKLNSFCSWECAKKFICNFTLETHKDYLNLLIDISAGYKVHV